MNNVLRDWYLLLYAGAGLFLLAITFAAALYWWSASVPGIPPAPAGTQSLSPQKLAALLARYRALDTEHSLLLQTAPSFADPSITK